MKIAIELRLLHWIKRLAVAQESASESLATLARIELSRWEKESLRPLPSKKIVYGSLNIEEANKEHAKRLEREVFGGE